MSTATLSHDWRTAWSVAAIPPYPSVQKFLDDILSGTMKTFCLHLFRKSSTSSSNSSGSEKGQTAFTSNLDLLGDEGANVQNDLWQLTVNERLNNASNWADPSFYTTLAHATCESSLQDLRDRYTANGQVKRIPAIAKILNGISPFVQGVTSMTQGSATASLIWGSVQLVMQVCSRGVRS